MSEAVADVRKEPELNRAALAMLVASLVTTMIGPFLYYVRTLRVDTFLATLLLIVPSALIALGATRLLTVQQDPPLLTLGMSAFDIFKNVLITAYVCCGGLQPGPRRMMWHVLSIFSLVIACVLVGLVFRLTSWLVGIHTEEVQPPGPRPDWLKGMSRQLMQHHFFSICGILVASLHLMLFLALSVAFHDRATGGISFEREVHRNDLPGAAIPISERQAAADAIRTFAFPLGSTSLRCAEAASSRVVDPTFYAERTDNEWRVEQLEQADMPDECAGELREAAWNAAEMHDLKSDLTTIYDRSAFDRYRVVIVAHATDNRPNYGFASNYEMSRARAEQVQALVETIFAKLRHENSKRPPLNVEWQIMPSGTGNMYLSPTASPDARRLATAQLTRALTTEVQFTRIPDHLTKLQRDSLERQNGHGATPELQLLDYLYYMITSAAGSDLAPASGFVQFVSAIGHGFQFFLLVVAFNVILAFRRPAEKGAS